MNSSFISCTLLLDVLLSFDSPYAKKHYFNDFHIKSTTYGFSKFPTTQRINPINQAFFNSIISQYIAIFNHLIYIILCIDGKCRQFLHSIKAPHIQKCSQGENNTSEQDCRPGPLYLPVLTIFSV